MNSQIQISDLNAMYACIGSLREAHALLSDRCRGTSDLLHDLCKDYERVIKDAEASYKRIRQLSP